MKTLYQIDTGYACFGIVTENNIIIETAPIGQWMIGKTAYEIVKWCLKNKHKFYSYSCK